MPVAFCQGGRSTTYGLGNDTLFSPLSPLTMKDLRNHRRGAIEGWQEEGEAPVSCLPCYCPCSLPLVLPNFPTIPYCTPSLLTCSPPFTSRPPLCFPSLSHSVLHDFHLSLLPFKPSDHPLHTSPLNGQQQWAWCCSKLLGDDGITKCNRPSMVWTGAEDHS